LQPSKKQPLVFCIDAKALSYICSLIEKSKDEGKENDKQAESNKKIIEANLYLIYS